MSTLTASAPCSDAITQIETWLVDLPTIRAHRLSMTTLSEQTLVIVRLHTADGIVGIGEAATINGLSYGPESPEGVQMAIERYFAPLLIGQNACSIRALRHRMAQNIRGNWLAKSALETALLDAQGKRLGVSVATLLGGAIQQELPVLWVLASGNTQQDIAEAQQMIELRRHQNFKLKIGSRPVREDIAHVTAIRQALPEHCLVQVDVNQAWDEATAVYGMRALQEAGVDLVEQPVAAQQHDVLARLSQRFDIPILADESVATATDGYQLACQAAAPAYALKIGKAGGPLGTLALAEVALAAGIGLYGGTLLEGSIATQASAQTFAVLPELRWGTELFSPLLLKDDVITTPLNYDNFALHTGDAPGLGLELDEDKLQFYARN